MAKTDTKTGGREATSGVIPGCFALSVGLPDLPAPTGWMWSRLSDLARLETGHTPSRRHPEYWNGEIPWIGIKDARRFHGRDITSTIQSATQNGIDNSSARLLPAGTVCLSRTASIGYITRMRKPMATSQDFVNWVCGPELDSRYLMYVLLSEVDSFSRFSHGTTHQTIYFPEVKAFHILRPPLAEQRRIASILGALDDKIELNRQMNRTLEEMAQAIFRSWFVDFDGHDDLVDSELGKIPRGWTVTRISDVTAFLKRGIAPEYLEEGGVPVLNQKCIRDFRVSFEKARRHDPAARKIAGRELELGDVLINSTGVGTLGRIAELAHCPEDAIIVDTHITVVRRNPGLIPRHFFTASFFSKQMEIERMGEGSTGQTELKRALVGDLLYLLPPRAEMDRFDCVVAPMREKQVALEAESQTLAELRDTLLPKLISGEIRVPEAEERLAAAA